MLVVVNKCYSFIDIFNSLDSLLNHNSLTRPLNESLAPNYGLMNNPRRVHFSLTRSTVNELYIAVLTSFCSFRRNKNESHYGR